MNTEDEARGLVIVHTGDGKGKTTAALGMAVRGAGHGLNTLIVQFIKGDGSTGELKGAEYLRPYLEIIQMGKGMLRVEKGIPSEEDVAAAREALEVCREKIVSGRFHMIVMDEINVAMARGLINEAEVLDILKTKPVGLHLVLTGRGAPRAVIDHADLVTEMKEIKHPYSKGIGAQKGVEF